MPSEGLTWLDLKAARKQKKKPGRKALEVLAMKFRETSWLAMPRR